MFESTTGGGAPTQVVHQRICKQQNGWCTLQRNVFSYEMQKKTLRIARIKHQRQLGNELLSQINFRQFCEKKTFKKKNAKCPCEKKNKSASDLRQI
jgi:hypothetical protein